MSELDRQARELLFDVAQRSIDSGLRAGRALSVDPTDYPPRLREQRATFTTLRHRGELRGCIGAIEATRSLVEDVAESAYAAAFRDPRFPALERAELADLELHLSVLSPLEPLEVETRESLIERLRKGVDGLLIEQAGRRGTFLPSVWESLPDAERFLIELERKAGLTPGDWVRPVRCWRYVTQEWGRTISV